VAKTARQTGPDLEPNDNDRPARPRQANPDPDPTQCVVANDPMVLVCGVGVWANDPE